MCMAARSLHSLAFSFYTVLIHNSTNTFSLGEFEITWTFEVASVFLMIPHQFFVLNSNLNDATLSSLGNLRYFDIYTPTPKNNKKREGG